MHCPYCGYCECCGRSNQTIPQWQALLQQAGPNYQSGAAMGMGMGSAQQASPLLRQQLQDGLQGACHEPILEVKDVTPKG